MTDAIAACAPDTDHEPAKNRNWGGARKGAGGKRVGAGGKRAGAGRKKKPYVPPPSKYAATERTIRSTPTGLILLTPLKTLVAEVVADTGEIIATKCSLRKKGAIKTTGSLVRFDRAWVYVARRRHDGCMKIGMTSDLGKRCKGLSADLCFAAPVNPGYARSIETLTLRHLGVGKGGSEWVWLDAERCANAVVQACLDVELSTNTKRRLDVIAANAR